jgi:MFS family permease
LDVPGTLLVCAGLFAVVFGLANAELHPWTAPHTWAFLTGGAVLLAMFLWWQTRAAHPLLPPRVLLDRTRGGANLAIFIAGIGLFGVFLFLNYLMQQFLHYSPIATGIAFLPMVAALAITGAVCATQLYPRLGARPLVVVGMLTAAVGMAWLADIDAETSYLTGLLGPLMLFGIGIGGIVAPAMNAGTAGVEPRDAGIASATVNIAQQCGGAIGVALLNSVAATALSRYTAANDTKASHPDGAIYSSTIAFWWSSAIFTAGAIVCAVVLPRHHARQLTSPDRR